MLTSHHRNILISFLIVLAAMAVHAMMISFPPINFEFAFVDAARYFNAPGKTILLDEYFNYQANTLGLSYLAAVMGRLAPGLRLLEVLRIINIVGIGLLGIGIYRICAYLKFRHGAIVLALVILNPIVWTFSGRATADFMPMAVGIFAISLMLGEHRFLLRALMAGLILGLAAILKYHVLSELVFLAALLARYRSPLEAIAKSALVAVVALIIIGLYLVKAHAIFGFWVTPPKFQEAHHLHVTEIFNNLVLYTGFIGLCGLPTFILSGDLHKALGKYWRYLAAGMCVLLIGGLFGLHDGGELNFGPLDALMGPTLRIVALSLASIVTLLLVFMPSEAEDHVKTRRLMACSVMLVLLVFSMTRPAQRYLLFSLPFFLLAVPAAALRSRKVVLSMLFLFVAGNGFIEYSRWSTGIAAQIIADQIQARNLLEATNASAVEMHVGDRFYQFREMPKHYVIVAGNNPKAITVGSSPFPFLQKSFSLIATENQ